jgi:nucleotide-binding universal stress UspA family protein
MYEKILVPLDGSARAEAILPHVIDLARGHQSHVIFLYVIDPGASLTAIDGMSMDVNREIIEEQAKEAETYLASKKGEFQAMNIEAQASIAYGSIVSTIIDVAESQAVDLIAIASHGRSGLARMFYGSVAAGVLQRVDRPLLLIRAQDE